MDVVDGRIDESEAGARGTRARMSAFFFHDETKPLFGLYGPPCGERDRDEGVLLCAPTGHEYQRTHWCLRVLAAELLRAGFHVFRFDYSCMGDSWGSFEEATVERWVGDVRAAVQELADNAGVTQISVVGLRLGASLAYAAAREVSLHQLVLWDPVADGQGYVEQLRRLQTRRKETWAAAPSCTPGAAFEDLLGYRYSAALIEQLRGLSLDGAPPRAGRVSRLNKNVAGWDDVDAYAEPVLLADARRAVLDLLGGSA